MTGACKISFQVIWFRILRFLRQRAIFKFNFGDTGRNSLYTTLWYLLVYFKFFQAVIKEHHHVQCQTASYLEEKKDYNILMLLRNQPLNLIYINY